MDAADLGLLLGAAKPGMLANKDTSLTNSIGELVEALFEITRGRYGFDRHLPQLKSPQTDDPDRDTETENHPFTKHAGPPLEFTLPQAPP